MARIDDWHDVQMERSGTEARLIRVAIIAGCVMFSQATLGHGDEDLPRYVAEQGVDAGDCTLPVRPCRSIQYAAAVARKGSQVRVAAGRYRIETPHDIFHITSGVLDVRGGFSRFDHFLAQAPASNPTTLIGVPAEFRDQLRAQGFHVIADRKGGDHQGALADLRRGYGAMLTSGGTTQCDGGSAGSFPCHQIDMLAHLALADFSSKPALANDIWGFVDLNTEREYALIGLYNGTAVVDVTDPAAPFEVGFVAGAGSLWRDLKVAQYYDSDDARWRSYAYVSTDGANERLVVMDLTGLPNRVALGHRIKQSSPIHNVYVSSVDYATGVPMHKDASLHVLGSSNNGGAFRSYALQDAADPKLARESSGGYSHDATSMRVTDDRAAACGNHSASCQVLIDFNEDSVDLWDLTDGTDAPLLSSIDYTRSAYVHSGWWSEDGRFLFVQDELDEARFTLPTTLRVFDLADLTNPVFAGSWEGPTNAIDHNGYTRGNRYYMSNYTRGLTVLDITNPAEPVDIGFFDTYPVSDTTALNGAWGVFPFLPSGSVLVSDIDSGLYVLADRTRVSDGGQIGFTASAFGAEEGSTATVSVARSGGTKGAVSVDYVLFAGSADSTDFAPSTGTLVWADDDEGVRTIEVPLLRDEITEPMERAFVRLGNPVGGVVLADTNTASVFIGDPGGTTTIGFTQSHISVDETARRVIATIARTGSPVGTAEVDYEVLPITAVEAVRRIVYLPFTSLGVFPFAIDSEGDYRSSAGNRLSWEDGDAASKTIAIELIEDDIVEIAERFEVRLSSPSGATLAGNHTLTVNIGADTGVATTGFLLFDGAINQDVQKVRDGAALDPGAVADVLNIRAVPRDPDAVGSMQLTLSGAVSATRTDQDPPYLLYDDGGGTLPLGEYELTATPYPEPGLGGEAGLSLTVTFSVVAAD